MGNSKHDPALGIRWSEFRFPSINLWVVASLPYLASSGKTAATPVLDTVHRHMRGRKPKTRHTLHHRLESLLAMRGGKI